MRFTVAPYLATFGNLCSRSKWNNIFLMSLREIKINVEFSKESRSPYFTEQLLRVLPWRRAFFTKNVYFFNKNKWFNIWHSFTNLAFSLFTKHFFLFCDDRILMRIDFLFIEAIEKYSAKISVEKFRYHYIEVVLEL